MDVVKQSDAKMNQMRQFLATLVVIWTAACIAAYFYSQEQNIPGAVALAVVPAFLLELGLYLVPGFAAVRKAFERLGAKPQRALLLTASGAIPYLVESPLTGTFHFSSLALLVAVLLVTSFWYVAV